MAVAGVAGLGSGRPLPPRSPSLVLVRESRYRGRSGHACQPQRAAPGEHWPPRGAACAAAAAAAPPPAGDRGNRPHKHARMLACSRAVGRLTPGAPGARGRRGRGGAAPRPGAPSFWHGAQMPNVGAARCRRSRHSSFIAGCWLAGWHGWDLGTWELGVRIARPGRPGAAGAAGAQHAQDWLLAAGQDRGKQAQQAALISRR